MMKILRTPPPASMGTTHTHALNHRTGRSLHSRESHLTKKDGLGALHREEGNLETDSLLMFG